MAWKTSRNQFKYKPAELEALVNQYFDDCEEKGVFPDEAGMLIFLDVSPYQYYDWNGGNDPNNVEEPIKSFRDTFARARLRRESWLTRKAVDNKTATGAFNMLKQPKNGGYVDKVKNDQNATITIRIGGVDGKDAFA